MDKNDDFISSEAMFRDRPPIDEKEFVAVAVYSIRIAIECNTSLYEYDRAEAPIANPTIYFPILSE